MAPGGYNIGKADNRRIICDLQAGDEACFDAVYRHYYRPLCAYASQYVALHHAEELVQDTMMWLWENRASLVPELSLRALLFMIVKNKSLNRISHNQIKYRVHRQIADKFAAKFDEPDFYMENELLDLFASAIGKLPEEFRAVFLMHRMDGLTHKEIAAKLDVSHQTVNYRIGRAMRILRDELKDYLPLMLFILR